MQAHSSYSEHLEQPQMAQSSAPSEAACWSTACSAPGTTVPAAQQPSCLPRALSPEEISFLAFLREAILTLNRGRTRSWLFLLVYQQVTLS